MRIKPRVLIDIKTSKTNAFSRITSRVNLAYKEKFHFPFEYLIKSVLVVGLGIYLLFGSALAPVHQPQIQAASQNEENRAVLEKQLADLESQITQYESTVSNYKKQGKNLQSEIDRLNSKISKLNLQIKAIGVTLEKLDEEIAENKEKVTITENDLDFNKRALGSSLQNIYERERANLFEIILKNPQISSFISDINNFLVLQDNLRIVVEKISHLREELLDEQEQLAVKKSDAVTLRAYQDSQKATIQNVKQEKSQLLAVTKGQESKYQEILKETKKTAAQIRAQIFEFLGGGELSFEEAYKFAKVAEAATGVRAALILAVLDRESALGQNVGRCNYKTAMSPGVPPKSGKRDDISIFLALTAALGINPETMLVSCANSDGVFGGAMGPAQFIPSTWNLYANRVGEITGNGPPSPWRNGDAFVATGLYLKDAGAFRGATLSEERRAAARYYAGSRWQRYLWTYGERVVVKAQQFQSDIDVLNG